MFKSSEQGKILRDILDAHATWLDDRNQGSQAYFRYVNLINCVLVNKLIPSADFSGARAFNLSLTKSILTASDFSQTYFDNSDFTETTLFHVNMNHMVARYTHFYDAVMTKSSLYNAYFDNCDFIDTDLSGSDLRHTYFRGCRFEKTDFSKANLYATTFDGCSLLDLNLDQARQVRVVYVDTEAVDEN